MKNFKAVEDVRKRSHRSWKNLENAACKELGLPYQFGTANVEKTSDSYLRTAMKESGMSAAEILDQIEQRAIS